MCGTDALGTVGIILNIQGIMIAETLEVRGPIWLVLAVGVSLLSWIALAAFCFRLQMTAAGRFATKGPPSRA